MWWATWPRFTHHDIAASARFRQDFGLCGPVPPEKRFLINAACIVDGWFGAAIASALAGHVDKSTATCHAVATFGFATGGTL